LTSALPVPGGGDFAKTGKFIKNKKINAKLTVTN